MIKHVRIIGLTVLVAIGCVGTVYALPSVGHDTYYYATSAHGGSPVGEDYRGCQNDHFTWGDVTPYVENDEWSCSDPDNTYCYRLGYTSDHVTCTWEINTCESAGSGPC